jgi:hypothetical protein
MKKCVTICTGLKASEINGYIAKFASTHGIAN